MVSRVAVTDDAEQAVRDPAVLLTLDERLQAPERAIPLRRNRVERLPCLIQLLPL